MLTLFSFYSWIDLRYWWVCRSFVFVCSFVCPALRLLAPHLFFEYGSYIVRNRFERALLYIEFYAFWKKNILLKWALHSYILLYRCLDVFSIKPAYEWLHHKLCCSNNDVLQSCQISVQIFFAVLTRGANDNEDIIRIPVAPGARAEVCGRVRRHLIRSQINQLPRARVSRFMTSVAYGNCRWQC